MEGRERDFASGRECAVGNKGGHRSSRKMVGGRKEDVTGKEQFRHAWLPRKTLAFRPQKGNLGRFERLRAGERAFRPLDVRGPEREE